MINIITYYQSPVGVLEIRSDEDTINAILFTNSWKGSTLDESVLHFERPTTEVIGKCLQQLDEYFSGERKEFSLPIRQSGTPFQQTVWKELCNIPYGTTISYLTLSKRIGNVKAIRAVGTANGNNNISIVIPCHRVIGSNGNLVGYGGDLWRKKWLLDHEAKFASGVQVQTLF